MHSYLLKVEVKMLQEIGQTLDESTIIDINGNDRKVKCNYCSKIVSRGIFRFKHHLVGTRKDFEPCASISEEIKILMIKVVAEAKEASSKKRSFYLYKLLFFI